MDLIEGQTNLIVLSISNNKFSGSLTSNVTNLKYLQKFEADENNLSGTLPNELWNIAMLGRVHAGSNPDLSGTISPWIGNATRLQEVFLPNTGIDGTIPTEVGKLSALRIMKLSTTYIDGGIPTEIGNMGALGKVGVSLLEQYAF